MLGCAKAIFEKARALPWTRHAAGVLRATGPAAQTPISAARRIGWFWRRFMARVSMKTARPLAAAANDG
jgi:hypothetical protein